MTEATSREHTGNFVDETVTQAVDAVSRSKSVPSRTGMNTIAEQPHRKDLQNLQVDTRRSIR